MLFNSYFFILLFLPITLIVYFRLGSVGHHRVALSWLVAASLTFYGWWNPAYLGLIIASIIFNYALGVRLSTGSTAGRKDLLIIGIFLNLALIGYFKYANFFVENFNTISGTNYHLETIILPLAISFFTFQQITFLVDAYRGETKEYNFLHYCLFVTFFPQLIAGPIVHHKEMLPQFIKDTVYKFSHQHLAIGMTIFSIGLFKKVVLADGISIYSTPVFDAALHGAELSFIEAWGGALAYTFQLYFDFSGYSDMAIGIARMFGISLPLNFHSPYKARNIIDFWRRWHMTLSRFLRDYVYIPLGGNRNGLSRRHLNLMITMLLGGLWHGAGWTFIIWGALHGFYLIINHAWRSTYNAILGDKRLVPSWLGNTLSISITFVAVVIAWVFFRCEDVDAAKQMLWAMSGANGIALPIPYLGYLKSHSLDTLALGMGIEFRPLEYYKGFREIINIVVLMAIVWLVPNTQQIISKFKPALDTYSSKPSNSPQLLSWSPSTRWAIIIAIVSIWGIVQTNNVSEFLYYQF